MSDELPAGLTRDNIHLSEVIRPQADRSNCADVCTAGPIVRSKCADVCTNPEVLRFLDAATSANTRQAYQSDLGHFIAWGGRVPATVETLAAYIAEHAETLSAATLARRLVAIRRAHVLRGLSDPTKAEVIRLTFRGVRRLHGRPQRQVAPLKVEHLFGIASVLGDSTRDVRDLALLLIGFAGAFRRSELVAIKRDWIKHSDQGVEVTLPRSKTDQHGVGRTVAIPRINGPICPVTVLGAWLQMAEIIDGSVFRRVDKSGKVLRSPLSPGAVATIVKQRVGQIGLDPRNYSGHSLRAGFATCAAAAGLSAWDIKRQTGHVSDAILGRYIRESEQFRHLAAIWTIRSEGRQRRSERPSGS